MSDFVLYDYAVKVSLKEALAKQSLSYIRKPLVVCINADAGASTIETVEGLTSKTAIEAKTKSKGVSTLIDGGLTSIDLIVLPQSETLITSAKGEIQARLNKNFGVIIGEGVTGTNAQITDSARLNGNVIFKSFESSEIDLAKELAATDCAFIDNDTKQQAMYYAVAKLCSSSKWSNQQYIVMPSKSDTVTAADVGTAEGFFTDRLSFFIDDDTLGRGLGFFVAGGKSIVDRFVKAEVSRKLQETGLQYVSKMQPMNTEDVRDSLTLEMRSKVFKPYEDQGLLVAGESVVNIEGSTVDEFTAVGNFSMKQAVALWRLNIQLEA